MWNPDIKIFEAPTWFQCAPKVETHHQHWPAEHLLALNSLRQFVENTDSGVSPPEMWFCNRAQGSSQYFFSPSSSLNNLCGWVWMPLGCGSVGDSFLFISISFSVVFILLSSLIHCPFLSPYWGDQHRTCCLPPRSLSSLREGPHEQSVAVQYKKI